MTALHALVCLLPMAASVAMADSPLQFDFGAGVNAREISYEATRGFGFEPAVPGELGRRFSIKLHSDAAKVEFRYPDAPGAFSDCSL